MVAIMTAVSRQLLTKHRHPHADRVGSTRLWQVRQDRGFSMGKCCGVAVPGVTLPIGTHNAIYAGFLATRYLRGLP
jgi:hypothetical protein